MRRASEHPVDDDLEVFSRGTRGDGFETVVRQLRELARCWALHAEAHRSVLWDDAPELGVQGAIDFEKEGHPLTGPGVQGAKLCVVFYVDRLGKTAGLEPVVNEGESAAGRSHPRELLPGCRKGDAIGDRRGGSFNLELEGACRRHIVESKARGERLRPRGASEHRSQLRDLAAQDLREDLLNTGTVLQPIQILLPIEPAKDGFEGSRLSSRVLGPVLVRQSLSSEFTEATVP
jgi:hypothetical protein